MKTWQTKDRSKWENQDMVPDDEPDKAQWIDEATGLDCLIVRGPSGALCGYVGVPESSKHFQVDYDSVMIGEQWPSVHGGLTFADRCQPNADESTGICHTGDVANKKVWWLGFDCAQLGDLMPAYESFDLDVSYRDFTYVKREVENLASQLVG